MGELNIVLALYSAYRAFELYGEGKPRWRWISMALVAVTLLAGGLHKLGAF